MSIDKTQHLSKLSHDEIKTLHKQWPNPLTPLGFMIGGLFVLTAALLSGGNTRENVWPLFGGIAALIIPTFISCILSLMKVIKAKKALKALAEKYNLPYNELFKEFKQNLNHMRSL